MLLSVFNLILIEFFKLLDEGQKKGEGQFIPIYLVVKLNSSYLQNFYAIFSIQFNSNSIYFLSFQIQDKIEEITQTVYNEVSKFLKHLRIKILLNVRWTFLIMTSDVDLRCYTKFDWLCKIVKPTKLSVT